MFSSQRQAIVNTQTDILLYLQYEVKQQYGFVSNVNEYLLAELISVYQNLMQHIYNS